MMKEKSIPHQTIIFKSTMYKIPDITFFYGPMEFMIMRFQVLQVN